jgi:hypothetical protein
LRAEWFKTINHWQFQNAKNWYYLVIIWYCFIFFPAVLVDMQVNWTRHAKWRFAERAAKQGINYGDIEFEIKKQSVKIPIVDNKFRTIFKSGNNLLTAVKVEKNDFIHVLTLWESSEKEAELWKERK